MEILTPFYRDSAYTSVECPPNNDANYTPYTLFSFRNWIYYYIRDEFGPDVLIEYTEVDKDRKTFLGLKFTLDDKEILLSKNFHQDLSNKIKSYGIDKLKWLPVFYFNQDVYTNSTKIPKVWVNSMLRYINIGSEYIPEYDLEKPAYASEYQAYLSEIGILVNLSGNPDYLEIHAEMTQGIKESLINHYISGTVANPPPDIITNWKLVPIGNDGLYKPDWNDPRIYTDYMYMTDFLISRIEGESSVHLRYSNDLDMRYYLAEKLGDIDYIFTDEGLDVKISSYNEIKDTLDVIDGVLNTDHPDVILDIMYLESINEANQLDGGVIFRTDDQERPYTYVKIIK